MLSEAYNTLNSKFQSFRNEALNSGVLSERDRVLAALVASISYESSEELRKWMIKAKQVGISQEEIDQLAAICLAIHISKLDFFGQANEINPTDSSGSSCCV
ncbi:carboxymuconolactone decarboxylase family protein [Staphylospora marina]|uniref:carboxymuconolactone decarboxylase family protein n=1 Tax=Staphylospora marina TaxID=2490858 RepID=UPI000F5C08BB|nr:carboxymuconolactone decarboxylase family protein [Staphylospora marina]